MSNCRCGAVLTNGVCPTCARDQLAEFPKLAAAVAGVRCALSEATDVGPLPGFARAVLDGNADFRDEVVSRLAAAAELLGEMLAWHEERRRVFAIVRADMSTQSQRLTYTSAQRLLYSEQCEVANASYEAHDKSAAWLRAELAKLEASS